MTHLPGTTAPAVEDSQFLANLFVGRLRWDLLSPFPEQEPTQRRIGDRLVHEISAFITSVVDPEQVDRSRQLPDVYLAGLHPQGYLALNVDTAHGGLGLSAFNTFRVVTAAMSWSIAAAYVIAIHAGQGLPAILPALPPGPLRDLVVKRVAEGAISGWADTEPTGAANRLPTTTARAVDGGSAYLLTGRKLFIGNGSVADEMIVTATVQSDDGAERASLFIVDAHSPGYRVESVQDLLCFHGLPLAVIELDNVRVPAERLLLRPEDHWRLSPLLEPIGALGRLYVISGAALATGRLCLQWSRDFANRRLVDGRGLGEYDEIQRMVSASLAEVFAMESVVHWCLLGDDAANLRNRHFEWVAAKNLNSVTGWRLVERTLSLMAAEGLETADSKARRGAPPVPLERFFRDIRGLRVAGAVDFHVDQRAAESFLSQLYYPAPNNAAEIDSGDADLPPVPDADLSERNLEHLRHTAEQIRRFARTCLALVRRHPDPSDLFLREHTLIVLNRIADELFTMSVVLARAASLWRQGDRRSQDLADVYCTMSRHRLVGLWHELDDRPRPPYDAVCETWLHGDVFDYMLHDLATGR